MPAAPRPRRLLALALAAALGLGPAAAPARAWGRIGHRVAGALAEARLTPAARAAVKDLLEPGETLADASTWADEVRREHPEAAPWHYVNVPITADGYDPKYCPDAGCVISAIDRMEKIVADPSKPKAERRDALRFLVHFIEDMHQPVHVGDRGDRGGNDLQLRFFDQGTNLHRLWDSGLIEHASKDESAWLKRVGDRITPQDAAAWTKGDVIAWANESHALAKQAYVIPGTDTALKPGTKLGQEYEDAMLPKATDRLAQSAVRLAAVLNRIFG